MATRYNDSNYHELRRRPATFDGRPEVLPRTTLFGSAEAERFGLVPMLDYPDDLVEEKDFKEVIEYCHEQKIFPVYHQKASGVLDDGWNQDGYGYCWAYGLTMAAMDCRALEELAPRRLSPFSLGWLVNWRNTGYYCDRAIAGARERGIASVDYVPEYELNPKRFKDDWEKDALNHRPSQWWDTYKQNDLFMIRQCLTILRTGRAGYVAYNWWSHALEVCGMHWDESELYGIVWDLRNSHGEDDVIQLTGRYGVPDEFYGLQQTSLPRPIEDAQ